MRKRDCLYLHALCVLVRRELEEEATLPEGEFERYEALGVGPSDIHKPKSDHQRALVELLDALERVVDGGVADGSARLRSRADGGPDRGEH